MKLVVSVSAFLLFFCFEISAQKRQVPWGHYMLELTDKAGTAFSTARPQEYLSPKAMQRRQRESVMVDETDLPVSSIYIEKIKATGVSVHGVSKWLNAVVVEADTPQIKPLRELPFVKNITYLGRIIPKKNPPDPAIRARPHLDTVPKAQWGNPIEGYSSIQNELLGIPYLHRLGHRGEGIMVAVMDGGFAQSDVLAHFDSVAADGRMIQGHDFVEGDTHVFEDAQHGTSVLSVMASNLPGYFMGGAPDATYILLKTETTGYESPNEEFNWVMGAEFADSIGADIINASLGYTTFKEGKLNHDFYDLDGKTAVGSRGAAIAAQKGMLIFNSAGNSGNDAWKYIGVPSDAKGVVAVGAVQYTGEKAGFSSFGPTADGRIKPNLSAPGQEVITAGYKDADLGVSSGTSLASPMLAGAAAALWSSNPSLTSWQVLDALYKAANQAESPDNELGWGVPDVFLAYLDLENYGTDEAINFRHGTLAAFDEASIEIKAIIPQKLPSKSVDIRLSNILETPSKEVKSELKGREFSVLEFEPYVYPIRGFYIFRLIDERGTVVPIKVGVY